MNWNNKFWTWVDNHLPPKPKLRTIDIGEALGQAKPFSNLAARVASLEDRLNRAEKLPGALKPTESYPYSPQPPETSP